MKLPDQFLETPTRWFTYLYGLSSLFGITTAITFSLVWSHWHSTLNGCFSTDCGCCLYVTTTPGTITGSNIGVCWFITYAHLVIGLGGCAMTCWYCVRRVREQTRRARGKTRQRPVYSCSEHQEDSSFIVQALLSGVISVLLFSTAYMFTEGYIKTCSEYRRTVARNLKASGNLMDLISSRVSCTSILDMMDYTQPNTPRRAPRGGIINSALLLQTTGLLTWAHFGVWVVLLVYNTCLARQRAGLGGGKDISWSVGVKPKQVPESEKMSVIGTETSI
uniref:Uncharacterized protein n=1 Tax=Cacopsylla melanoneura TaxID=428564 RepID=A0A8D8Z390_9HEMI